MSLLERATNSEYKQLINKDWSIGNAVVIFSNFSGKPTKFNQAGGKRTFCVALSAEMADVLEGDGWNIKRREGREKDDDPLFYTEVVLNMDSTYPPKVNLYSEFRGRRSENALTGNMIDQLDDINIDNFDLVLHPYEHGLASAGSKIKGYVKAMYVLQGQDEYFGGKYDGFADQHSMSGQDDEIPFD